MDYFERLQHVARIKKVDQVDVATQTRTSPSTVSKWWNGKRVPGPKNTRMLADFFECDPLWLSTGEGEPFPPKTGTNINFNFTQPLGDRSSIFAEKIELLFSLHDKTSTTALSKIYGVPEEVIIDCGQGYMPSKQIIELIAKVHGIKEFTLTDDDIPPEKMFHFFTTHEGKLTDRLFQVSQKRLDKIHEQKWEDEEIDTKGMLENITKHIKAIEELQNNPQVRNFKELAQLDADTLGEIQTWINEKEIQEPGFTTWFRHEFKNRFPEFAEWKNGLGKEKNKTGTDN